MFTHISPEGRFASTFVETFSFLITHILSNGTRRNSAAGKWQGAIQRGYIRVPIISALNTAAFELKEEI